MSITRQNSRRIVGATLAALVLGTGLASAQTAAPQMGHAAPHAQHQAPQLSVRDVFDRVEAAGFRDIREIEYKFKRHHYKVKARDAQGERVKLGVDADNGEITATAEGRRHR